MSEVLKIARSIERKLDDLRLAVLIGFVFLMFLVAIGCAMTTGDPYGDGVPCYEGPLIIEKITPTPTPTETPWSQP